MQLLSSIVLKVPAGNATIELLQGDLSALPAAHEADILITSAFPNDYTPLPGSLFYALHQKGLEIGELAKNKFTDMVSSLSCWLSQPLTSAQQEQFHFKHVLCFEPSQEAGSPDLAVGNIFRCINNFAFEDDYNVIAMPLLATGRQKIPMDKMLPALLNAAIFWLQSGIPLDCIKLVAHNDEKAREALQLFNKVKQEQEPKSDTSTKKIPQQGTRKNFVAPAAQTAPPVDPAAQPTTSDYDCFISYSHKNSTEVAELVTALKAKNPGWNIFYDRSSIPTGGLWIKLISDAIQRSKRVVCVLSPQYRDSNVCWDEFQCAKAKEFRTKKPVIQTINLLKDDDMPLIMSIYSYIDCTEADVQKLKEAVHQIN